MKKHTLKAELRSQLGRKVKKIRKLGHIPASLYGKNVKSLSISVNNDDFVNLLKTGGESKLIDLDMGDSQKPVIIHNIQRHPVTQAIIHVEFFQVNLKEKVHAKVQVEYLGESPAVKDSIGVFLTLADEIEIEALPADLPEKISIDIKTLVEVGSEIKASDLKLPDGVSIITPPDTTLVRITAPVKAEEVTPAKEEIVQEGAPVTQDAEVTEVKEEAPKEK